MRRFLFLIVALFIAPAFAQSQHPFTFEDMMALKRVSEPIVSPDGKWVLFSAVDVSLEANTKTPHVWVVPAAGGDAREIIHVQESDRPRWAPDGKRFLFLSTQEGGSQIWIADFDGDKGVVTATHKLTSIATEADGPIWSPDGKNILFVSNVYPECTDEACNARKLDEAAKSKVKALIFTHLLYRHWNAYKQGMRNHLLIVSAEGGASRDLTPGDFDAPRFNLGGQDDYAFSPDGQEICYSSNHDPGRSYQHQQRPLARFDQWRRGQKHHHRKSRERYHAPVFSRWKIHRLSRTSAARKRERSLPAHAVRP